MGYHFPMRNPNNVSPDRIEAVYHSLVRLRRKRRGLVSPSYAEIAADAGIQVSAVGFAMAALERQGRVKTLGGRRAWVPTTELAEAKR